MRVAAECPKCGSPIPAAAPGGECPACLVRLAVAGAAPARPPLTPAELQAHFTDLEVVGLLGTGGMGAVYEVRNAALGRTAAMKVLAPDKAEDPEYAERFLREAQAQARLTHPRIAGVYDFGRAGDLVYLLMEYVDGVSLRDLLRAGRTTPSECLRLVGQICDALQYAHDRQIVHRDIKPENVLVDRAGNVKLVDFGLAKLGGDGRENFTDVGDRMGTARYMAPEQWANTAAADHRADIYSLGVLFYELLTGDLPTPQFTPPSAKAGTDRRLDRVVSKSLRDEPAERYQQAAEMRAAADRAVAPRRWGVWAVAAAAILLMAAAAVLRPPAAPPEPAPPPPVEEVWGPPENLGPGVNTAHGDASPCVSSDGRTLWFSSDRPGGPGGEDLYAATRPTTAEPFGDAVALGPAVNGPDNDLDPCVAADGTTLVFVSNRDGGTADLWMCRRADPAASWGEAAKLGPEVNSRFVEFRPWLRADGRTLTFTSLRPPAGATWVSRRPTADDPFGPAKLFGRGSAQLRMGGPSFSFDGKLMLVNRHNAAFPGDLLWHAKQDDPADPFRFLESFGPTVNGPHIDTNPVISADGKTVYFGSDRPGGSGGMDLWQTRRVPKDSE